MKTMRLSPPVIASLVLLIAPSLPITSPVFSANAQTAASAVIKEIHAVGSKNYTEAEIVQMSALKPGTPITREQLQATANYMARTGLFSNVNYRFTTTNADTNLEFQVQDAPVVPLWFDNRPW